MVVYVARRTSAAIVRNVRRWTVANAVQTAGVTHTVIVYFAFGLVAAEFWTTARYVSVRTFAVVAVVGAARLIYTNGSRSARIVVAFIYIYTRLVWIARKAGQTATLVAALRVNAFGIFGRTNILQVALVDVRATGRQIGVSREILLALE